MNSSYLMMMAMENDRLRTAQRYQRLAAARREHAVGWLRRRAPRHRAARTFTRRTATAAAAYAANVITGE